MNHLFRFAWLLLTSGFRRRHGDLLNASSLSFRVWPTDLDPLMHMNNGVYLSLMDLGRFDLMLKAEAFFKVFKAGIYPVIVSESIVFQKSLKLLQAFTIETQIAGWDEKYFYLAQKFMVKGEVYASAMVKARFLRRGGGKATTQEIWTLWGKIPGEPVTPPRAYDELEQFLRPKKS